MKTKTAAKTVGPVPASRHKRGFTPLTPLRAQASKSMGKLADNMRDAHPGMISHQHVRDAARMLRMGNDEAAQRHLRAAMFSLTPQSLHRNGMHADAEHIPARDAMHGVHRHLLLIKDIVDVAARNREILNRDSGDGTSAIGPMPPNRNPNNGFGVGALAQKPTARQPGGGRAMNAPPTTNTGGADPAVADPNAPQKPGSKQFTRNEGHAVGYTWNDVEAVIEMCADSRRVIDLDWATWDAGKGGGSASQTAHDTASATAKRTAALDWGKIRAAHGTPPPDKGGSDEEKADNHVKSAKVASMQGQHAVAAAHLARASALTQDPAKQDTINKVGKGAAQIAMQAGKGSAFQLANRTRAVAGPKG